MTPTTLIIISTSLFFSIAFAQNPEQERTNDAQKTPLTSSATPLFFNPETVLTISPPAIYFDLKSSDGNTLDFGNGILFKDDSLKASIENNELIISWDTNLISTGVLSIINEHGKELWSQPLNTKGFWKSKDLNNKNAPSWSHGEKFHFCLRSEENNGFVNLCTPTYALVINEKDLKIGRALSKSEARIIFQNEDTKELKGKFEVSAGAPVQFLATLKSKASYDFYSEPINPTIKDIVQSSKAKHILLTGEMPRPLKNESDTVVRENYSSLTRSLGFEKTIAVKEDLWQMDLPIEDALLSSPGKSGGVFTYKLKFNEVSPESERLFLTEPETSGTYLSHDRRQVIDAKGNVYIWEFASPKKWAQDKVLYNKSYLDIYHGASGEASLRLTGVSTSDGNFIAMGEGHVSWWFNDLFGWQNSLLSKQRWGLSAKYFSSLMKFPASTESGQSEDINLSALQTDLRYRLTPGLWERDESVGLIAAFESLTIGSDNIPKIGAGLFWARSMPRAIDKWFSKLPYMNYPKWVDMEAIHYFSTTDKDMKIQNDFALNFHGKVLWTPAFFGEAGFGVKNYQYEHQSTGYGAQITSFYGTLGLGINF